MKWLVAIVATEAVVEILLHSELFVWLHKPAKRVHLFDCGWCLSVWIGAGAFALIYFGLWWMMIPFAVARMSNVFHDAYGLLRR